MIEIVIEQRARSLGGFDVGRVLPFAKRRMVGPFVFLDHMGPVDLPRGLPKSVDVRPHPHIGLSTLTYLFAGEIIHRDSVGSEQPILPGEVNWMTAGRGITHSERFERARRAGDRIHGVQAWVALPEGREEIEPTFHHHAGTDLPQWQETGVTTRLIAGRAYGSAAAVEVHSPLFYLHWTLGAGARVVLPGEQPERALFVVSGRIEAEHRDFQAGQMPVFGRGGAVDITALEPSVVIALGGEPIGERFLYWNFVSSSKERLEQAKADWQARRMKLPHADDDEWIPLPEGASPAPNPMS